MFCKFTGQDRSSQNVNCFTCFPRFVRVGNYSQEQCDLFSKFVPLSVKNDMSYFRPASPWACTPFSFRCTEWHGFALPWGYLPLAGSLSDTSSLRLVSSRNWKVCLDHTTLLGGACPLLLTTIIEQLVKRMSIFYYSQWNIFADTRVTWYEKLCLVPPVRHCFLFTWRSTSPNFIVSGWYPGFFKVCTRSLDCRPNFSQLLRLIQSSLANREIHSPFHSRSCVWSPHKLQWFTFRAASP